MPNRDPLDESLQFSTVYEAMDSVFRENVVSRALALVVRFPPRQPPLLIRPFRKAVQGLQDTGTRTAPLILCCGIRYPKQSHFSRNWPERCCGLGRVTAGTADRVAEISAEHRDGGRIPGLFGQAVSGRWAANDWYSHRDNFIQKMRRYREDDVGLMLCYVTGKAPARSDAGSGGGVAGPTGEYLDQFLSYLKVLPPTARNGGDDT